MLHSRNYITHHCFWLCILSNRGFSCSSTMILKNMLETVSMRPSFRVTSPSLQLDQRRRNILNMRVLVVLILICTFLLNHLESSLAEEIQDDFQLTWFKLNEEPTFSLSPLLRMRGKRPYHPNHFFLRRWRYYLQRVNNLWKQTRFRSGSVQW